jgi:hypothetical protein
VNIIVRKKGSETERKRKEAYAQVLKRYYQREIRDGSRWRTKSGATKAQVKELYEGG